MSDDESDRSRSGSEAEEDNIKEHESASDEEEPEGENLNSEDEEDDYDDEDDEESAKYKRRKKQHGGFILDEAEVDDEVEDEEEWEEGADEAARFVRNDNDEHGPTAREIEGRRRGHNIWDSQKESDIEEYLRQRYANEETSTYRRFGDGDGNMNEEITQQTLLPGVKDPNLWLVKCDMGEEKSTALALMRKFVAYQLTDTPLQIKSVVVPEGARGYIYIEAFKQPHVKQAIEGIGHLRRGSWKQDMVAIKEMTDVMRVSRTQIGLKSKQWVRLKRGLYKDDIAQVDYVDVAQNEVHLKLLPRIDYTRKRGALRDMDESRKRPRSRRIPAKPFDPEAIRAIGGDVTTDGDYQIFEGNRYNGKGFLYKAFKINMIVADGIKPTLSELEKFEESPEGIDLEIPSAVKDNAVTHTFSNGDNVEVCQGELMHLQGKILSIDGNFIAVMPKHDDLKDPIEFQASELKKYFKSGDHVRVISGRYEGDTGLIIRAEENRVVLFSDLTMHECEVLPRDLQLCTDMATGVDSLGQFQYGDLVQLDAQTVGVIVRLEREIFHVLNMNGKVVEVKPQALTKKKMHKDTSALDELNQSIQRKAIVKVIDGPHNGRKGEVKHIFRIYVFLYSTVYLDNGGIFVCKSKHLRLAGSTGSLKPTPSDVGFMSPRISSPMHPSNDGSRGTAGGRGGHGGGGMPRRDREMIGKTIKISRGPYKGNIGIVKDSTDTNVRVELHTSCLTLLFEKKNIVLVGAPTKDGSFSSYSKTPSYNSGQTPMYSSGAGGRTPMAGSQTPLYDGSRTPHYGGATPLHDGSRTPGGEAWNPASMNTPARHSESEYNYDDAYNGNDYVPQTPGSNYASSDNSYSPYNTSASPGPAYHSSSASSSSYTQSPSPSGVGGGSYGSSGSIAYSPMTPGSSSMSAPSPYNNPATPGSNFDFNSNADWHVPKLHVRITDNHEERGLWNQEGIIRDISRDGVCSVFMEDEGTEYQIANEFLVPVQPNKGDRIKVITGDHQGKEGVLLNTENFEGLVSLDDDKSLMILLKEMCKCE